MTIDFIIGLLETRYNKELYNIILVIIDRFSKYLLFFPIYNDIIAAELATLFHNKVELQFETLLDIVSDRESLFTSEF